MDEKKQQYVFSFEYDETNPITWGTFGIDEQAMMAFSRELAGRIGMLMITGKEEGLISTTQILMDTILSLDKKTMGGVLMTLSCGTVSKMVEACTHNTGTQTLVALARMVRDKKGGGDDTPSG